MRTLALCALTLFGCVPNAAGAGCSPLTCGSSQVALANGAMLGVRTASDAPFRIFDLRNGRLRRLLPSGVLIGGTLVHRTDAGVTWLDATSGTHRASAPVAKRFGRLVGVSQDGKRAVVASARAGESTFLIVSPSSRRSVVLAKPNWAFDALSGNKLYLLQYFRSGYVVRLYDLATNSLRSKPLKDAAESAVIPGVPWVRMSSTDGRYLFTLYITPQGEAMVHELDVRAGIAHCIDLPGTGDFSAATTYALTLDPDGRTLWAVSGGYGKVAAIDIARARVRDGFGFAASSSPKPGTAVATMSPDGERLAVSAAGKLWFVTLALRSVTEPRPRVAFALGYSPDQRRLWAVGPGGVSEISPL